MECGKPFLLNIFTFNNLHGYLVENPMQTLIIRRHIVFLVWFIMRAWAACGGTYRNLQLIDLERFSLLALIFCEINNKLTNAKTLLPQFLSISRSDCLINAVVKDNADEEALLANVYYSV